MKINFLRRRPSPGAEVKVLDFQGRLQHIKEPNQTDSWNKFLANPSKKLPEKLQKIGQQLNPIRQHQMTTGFNKQEQGQQEQTTRTDELLPITTNTRRMMHQNFHSMYKLGN